MPALGTDRPSRPWRRRLAIGLAATCLAATGVIGGSAAADGVGDQQQKVQQIADQLDAISNQISQLADDYNHAQVDKDELDAEIVTSQAKVDAQQAELDQLQATLGEIAVGKYTSGSDTALSPVFSDAATYSDAQQRSELNRLSIDNGAGDVDQAAALATDLAEAKAVLESKQQQAAALVTELATKQAQANTLQAQYTTQYADAKNKLGNLIEEERQRREAAQAAAAAAATQAAQAKAAAEFKAKAEAAARQSAAVTQPAATLTNAPQPAAAQPAAAPAATVSAAPRGGGSTPSTAAAPTPEPSAPVAAPPPSSRAAGAVAAAMSQLGVPYVFAASSPGVAFDCSGLTKYAWGTVGVSLPHFAASQYATTPHVSQDQIQPGDLLYYHSPIGHVAIYIGNNQLIHAPRTGDVVKIATVNWGSVVGISRPG